MEVYLVRHGQAKAETMDPAQPLSERGREEVERVARHAAARGLRVVEIRHSRKLRARETAEILAAHLAPARGVREVDGLAPADDPAAARQSLEEAHEPLMLVGHLPHLSRLASSLLLGDAGKEIVHFGNASLACLARTDGGWRLEWILTPDLAAPHG
jgi:phosphohistidine phosphatase